MKRYLYLFLTIALVALASCSSDKFAGNADERDAGQNRAISFNMNVPAVTDAEAATELHNTFYVYGIKKEATDGAGAVGTGNLVFRNYVVKWTDNTAFSTNSNTKNWEYVGYTPTTKESDNVNANSEVAQTVKYWDYKAADYTFYAFSALPNDLLDETDDKISVSKNQTVTTSVYDNGYTVELEAYADLDNLFFSERVNITASNNTNRLADNAYGGNVTFRFHSMAAKVRVAMYETIPDYNVTINQFLINNEEEDPDFIDMVNDVTNNFAANFQNNPAGTKGRMTVKYHSTGAMQNHPTVTFTPDPSNRNILNVLILGEQLAAGTTLGETVASATFDQAEQAYTSVFPKENNTQDLKLKVSYTMTNPVTNETVMVNDATAVVPARYLQWKPGYAYTYIFKITDGTIVLDVVETVSDDGTKETNRANEAQLTQKGGEA